ncbi:MAG: hypothetical protein ACYTFA_16255 [Planctomycetota bacterium]|jgi:hypothetical protein
MRQDADFGGDDPPGWLVDVAVRVDELVSQTEGMQRFRDMIRQQTADHAARDPLPPTYPDGQIRYNPVELLPIRETSLAEKYATLAAIHDVVCQRTQEINPWPVDADKEYESGDYSMSIAGTTFSVLCSKVKDVSADDRAQIERCLHVVHADMRGDGTVRRRAKRRKGPTKPRKTDPTPLDLNIYSEWMRVRSYRKVGVTFKMSATAVGNHVRFVQKSLKRSKSVPTQQLPHDKRGQVDTHSTKVKRRRTK